MRLIEIEDKLKQLIEEDINNPEVFNTINKLIYLHIKRRKLVSCDRDAQEIDILMAEDLYMKILRGEPLYSWLGYISKACIGYIRKYRKMNSSEIIDTTGNYELMESIIQLSSASYDMSQKDYNTVIAKMSLNNVTEIVEGTIEKVCRYDRFSSQYTNFVISAYISIIKNEACTIFLDESESMQFRIIFAKVKEAIQNSYGDSFSISNQGYSIMQLYTMEGSQSD